MHTYTHPHTHTHTQTHTRTEASAHAHTWWHADMQYIFSFAVLPRKGVPATYTSNFWTMHTKTSHFQKYYIYNHIILLNNTAPVASHSHPNIPPVYSNLIVPASTFPDTVFIFMTVLENMFYHINYYVTTKQHCNHFISKTCYTYYKATVTRSESHVTTVFLRSENNATLYIN